MRKPLTGSFSALALASSGILGALAAHAEDYSRFGIAADIPGDLPPAKSLIMM
ncbi:hypothetical protein AB9K34_03110 [Sedimentitalea sp. XS_ASV28]|uniref:hypothetical protein n=1 Tax=Sedimentitalea sp. XS_ASV28 TaxID=3241296 RepID=UPI0035176152